MGLPDIPQILEDQQQAHEVEENYIKRGARI